MTLTEQEKEDLLRVIEILFGYSSQMRGLKSNFKVQTVHAVEEAVSAMAECNSHMKALVVGLVGGANALAKGWLRQVLAELSQHLADERVKFDGIACRNAAAYSWHSTIILSTY